MLTDKQYEMSKVVADNLRQRKYRDRKTQQDLDRLVAKMAEYEDANPNPSVPDLISEPEYERSMARVRQLMDARFLTDEEGGELDHLVSQIVQYERHHYSMGDPTSLSTVEFWLDQDDCVDRLEVAIGKQTDMHQESKDKLTWAALDVLKQAPSRRLLAWSKAMDAMTQMVDDKDITCTIHLEAADRIVALLSVNLDDIGRPDDARTEARPQHAEDGAGGGDADGGDQADRHPAGGTAQPV